MSLSAAEVWDRLLARARQELPEQTFRTWLEPTAPLAVDGRRLLVGTPDRFSAEWNESKHAPLLASYAPIALGHPLDVAFQVDDALKNRPQIDFFVEAPVAVPMAAPAPAAVASAPAFAPEAAGRAAPPRTATYAPVSAPDTPSAPLNLRYTFANFVVGKSNDVAAAAAMGAAEAPGRVYNPLFIYGDTGLGKTHLMQAVAHAMLERNPATRITYIGTEQFTNEFIAALQSRTTADFRRRYRATDLLLVDDIQFLKGKETTQEEFFHTFNAIYEAGRQICLTSDRPPKEIPGLEARLVSRFEWGMVAHVDLPAYEDRLAILQQKAGQDHLQTTIPGRVLEFIAQHVKSSVRELEGAIVKLLAFASLKRRDVTLDLAHEALRDKLRSEEAVQQLAESARTGVPVRAAHGIVPGSPLTPFVIQQAVAAEWRVTPDGLQSKVRTKTLTVPRQVGMYLCRELLALQLVEIGNAFGGRDHSTVIHSLERAAAMMSEDDAFRARVEKVRGMLESLRS
ncbi:chromosomal replication initiator protein DnaA [Gemmatimonadetes bacterium T265]|nr:chromosomal replication initiator protein DnaA [Gemmatimonadetes bacterium T265]